MPNRVSTYWDKQATSFDSIYLDESKLSRRVNELVRRAVYDRFHIALRESGDVRGKRILDIGCGSGHYEVEYAKRGAREIVGIDFAHGMLELARSLAAREGVGDRCRFVEGDFMQFPFEGDFDVVIAMGVFDYVDKPVEFLRRMAELSTGRVICSFPRRNLVRMHLRRWRYALRNCPVFFYTEAELRKLAADAGIESFHLVPMNHSGGGWVFVGTSPRAAAPVRD